ncbi:MAG: hypothetical protein WC657_03865 [Candidatus Paceibacterota bacterium]|jgi:hypothetical protein
MASLPADIKDLNPSSTKEWLMHINGKLDDALESQADDRDTVIRYMERIDKWIECHDKEKLTEVQKFSTLAEKVDHIDKRVNTWNLTNTLAAIGAFITALFMKSS